MDDKLVKQSQTAVAKVATFEIKSVEIYKEAVDFLNVLDGFQKQIKSAFDPIVEAAHRAHKEATEKRKSFLAPLEQAERALKNKMADFIQEQEKIRRETEEKLRREAEKKQAELLAKAKAAEKAGEEKKAERYEEKAEAIDTAPTVVSQTSTVEGVSTRMVWDFDILDESQIPREYLTRDDTKIRQAIQRTNGEVRIKGVRIYQRPIIVKEKR